MVRGCWKYHRIHGVHVLMRAVLFPSPGSASSQAVRAALSSMCRKHQGQLQYSVCGME